MLPNINSMLTYYSSVPKINIFLKSYWHTRNKNNIEQEKFIGHTQKDGLYIILSKEIAHF